MMLFLAAFLLIAASGNAQGLTGQILDGKNSPVKGAAVAVKGGESVTTADDGSFTLSASADDVITVSHPDYLYKEMKVGRVGAKGLTVHVERRFVDRSRQLSRFRINCLWQRLGEVSFHRYPDRTPGPHCWI